MNATIKSAILIAKSVVRQYGNTDAAKALQATLTRISLNKGTSADYGTLTRVMQAHDELSK